MILRIGWIASFASAALTYPLAWAIASSSVEAWEITPHDPSIVTLNQGMFALDAPDPKDPSYPRKVMEIYGVPAQAPNRWLFVPPNRLIRPPELPSLTLLPVDRQKSQDPLQVQTVYFFAKWIAGGAAIVGTLLISIWLRRRTIVKYPQ